MITRSRSKPGSELVGMGIREDERGALLNLDAEISIDGSTAEIHLRWYERPISIRCVALHAYLCLSNGPLFLLQMAPHTPTEPTMY